MNITPQEAVVLLLKMGETVTEQEAYVVPKDTPLLIIYNLHESGRSKLVDYLRECIYKK